MTDPELLGARSLRALLAKHGATPRKELGQNFVVDPNTIRKIVEVAGVTKDDEVVEIGAGAGSLTLGLAAKASTVVAIETDAALIAALSEVSEGLPNVKVVHGDASVIELGAVPASVLVANLPYNIAATLMLRVLEEAPQVRRGTVMVQKEVGERLAARPPSRVYGATSVLVAFRAEVSITGRIARGAFYPVPEVDSVLVSWARRKVADVDEGTFKQVVKAAFSQRRKTLRNSLASTFGTEATERALHAVGIDPGDRAERIPVEGYVALTRSLHADLS